MTIKNYVNERPGRGETPQSEPIPGTSPNNAGGYSFTLDTWKRLDRFLILGSEGGTYYVSERKLTKANAQVVAEAWKADPGRTAARIVAVSQSGLAPKNDPAIFSLAIGLTCGPQARKEALAALPAVCRIGTHLFHFMAFAKGAGSGRSIRKAVQRWYLNRTPEKLAVQMVKYQARDGWSHRDVLRTYRPAAMTPAQDALFAWAVKGDEGYAAKKAKFGVPVPFLEAFLSVKNEKDEGKVIRAISEAGLPRECVPTEMLTKPDVWAALLPGMGMTAMIRNLGNMSKVGLLVPKSETAKSIVARLGSEDELRKARVHPYGVLLALATYGAGQSFRGKGEWKPVPSVLAALDAAFYKAFQFVQPTGKRIYIGLDVSGSMSSRLNDSFLSVREAACAMAMVTARTEGDYEVGAFAGRMEPFTIAPNESLKGVCERTDGLPFGNTDCALPMLDALKRKAKVDAFIVYTDSETWCGNIHPVEALARYRRQMGIPAKLIVVGMTSTEFTIADPLDSGMLDVVGFDASAPAVLSNFIADREASGDTGDRGE